MTWLEKIRELGWSQAKLGRKLGVTPKTISNWRSAGSAPEYVNSYLDLALQVYRLWRMIDDEKE